MGGEPFDPTLFPNGPPPGQVPPSFPEGMRPVEVHEPRIQPQPMPMRIMFDEIEGTVREDDGTVKPVKLVRCVIERSSGVDVIFASAEEADDIGDQWKEHAQLAKSSLTVVKGNSPVGG